MRNLHVGKLHKAYLPEDLSEGDRIRLYITYGYGEIEFREGVVLNPEAQDSFRHTALQLRVDKAGRIFDGKIEVDGAYCSVPRIFDKIKRGVDRNKPYTRKYTYVTRGSWLIEKLINHRWKVI